MTLIQPQSTIGILGGMSTIATGEYYQLINQLVRKHYGGYESAELLIASVNFGNIERFVRQGRWEEAGIYLAEKAKGLQAAGATCIFMATNTMHKVREAVKAAIQIPFIDIFETVGQAIQERGLKKVGILGTQPVMSDLFYQNCFREMGLELIAPHEPTQITIDQIIFDELTKNIFTPGSRDYFVSAMREMEGMGAQCVVLGCTEIKLLVQQEHVPGLPLFDTTTLHCERAARICTGISVP